LLFSEVTVLQYQPNGVYRYYGWFIPGLPLRVIISHRIHTARKFI